MTAYEKLLQEEPDLALLDGFPVMSNKRYGEDMDWANSSPEELKAYEGMWVAIHNKKIIATNQNPKQAEKIAIEKLGEKAKEDPPYMHFLEESCVIY